jgi:hypothetical protein
MSQLFPPGINIIVRLGLLGIIFALIVLGGLFYFYVESPLMTEVGVAKAQPIPYSHEQHVGGLGLDCRYCHSAVERSDSATLPSTETCMGCHNQVAVDSTALEPVRASLENEQPLMWIRVHDLADYVYFNHGIHVNKGVGCETCHGRVDQMPVVAKMETLRMDWCLACHRAPEEFIRPVEAVFTMGWQPPPDQTELGQQLIDEYDIHVEQLTDCSICHR